MSSKAERKEAAIAKAKRKKMFVHWALVLVLTPVISLSIRGAVRNSRADVYTDGGASVTLYADGDFAASLYHGERYNGIYTRTSGGDRTEVVFITSSGGVVQSAIGTIEGDELILPEAWQDGHGHGTILTKKQK